MRKKHALEYKKGTRGLLFWRNNKAGVDFALKKSEPTGLAGLWELVSQKQQEWGLAPLRIASKE